MMDEREFYRALNDWRNRRFDWSAAHCCHFCADVLAAATGRVIDLPPTDSAEAARDWLRSQGHASLYHYLVKLFGQPIPPLQAKRGYLVYRSVGLEGGALGVVDRQGLFLTDHGVIPVGLGDCNKAFRTHDG